MTDLVEGNGLDVAAIHPRNGSKYSPNLYAWLTSRNAKYRAWTSRVFSGADGMLYIGFLHDGDLIGSRLLGVLCNGNKEESWSLSHIVNPAEVPDFWARYTAVGRCAIDQEHSMFFIGDDARWAINGDRRECLWCGSHAQTLRRWIEPVERVAWAPIAWEGKA